MSLTYDTLETIATNLIYDKRYHKLMMWCGGYGKEGWKDGDEVDMDYIKQVQQRMMESLATIKTPSSCDNGLWPSRSVPHDVADIVALPFQ